MENGAFAPKKQMLHFPLCFQIHDISKPSKGVGFVGLTKVIKLRTCLI